VIFVVYLPQMLTTNMRINLGGRDLAMPEHKLDRSKICPSLQKVCGKRVPEHMRTDFFF